MISIVTTLFYSANHIEEFYNRMLKTIRRITDDYEMIFVNDGSPDNSADIVLSLRKKDKDIKLVDLSRNFGHHKAIMTGLSFAKGDLVFLIDSDLEEEPELLERFYNEMKRLKDVDVVYGIRKKRVGSFLESFTAIFFYKLINLISDYKIAEHVMTVRLMTKRYVKSLIKYREREIFLSGLWVLAGFNQKSVPVDRYRRTKSRYSFKKKVSNFVNAVTSFTNKPLIYIFYIGFIILALSSIYVAYLTVTRLFFNQPPPGYSSIVVSLWFLGGLTLCSLGILGIYISKIFIETKDRPYTIIREIYGDKESEH